MTLAKATVTGTVYREPQNRSTNNGVEIWDLILSVEDNSETLIRVLSLRRALTDVLNGISKGDKIIVDGRLQVGSSKTPEGADKKYFEIVANDIELLSGSYSPAQKTVSSSQPTQVQSSEATKPEEIVTFAETDFTDENLLDDEEVPF